MKDKRIGTFRIRKELINGSPEVVRLIMGRVIVVRAEYMYGGYIDYMAFSPEFDKIKEGDKAPEYDIVITNKMNGKKRILDKITFKRIN